jgi:hypothetical protein
MTNPNRRQRSKLRLVFDVSQVALLIAGALGILAYGMYRYANHRDFPDYIESDLAARANIVCAEFWTTHPGGTPAGPDATFEERAQAVERLTTTLESLVIEMRGIEGAADSRGFQLWLKDWDDFTSAGHEYAAAIRTGDQKKRERAGNKGDAPNYWMGRTAVSNGITECLPRRTEASP